MQFGFQMNFDDTEIEVLRRVIEHYLRVCRREIKQGRSVPFFAHSAALTHFRRNIRKQIDVLGKVTVFDSEMMSCETAFANYLDMCEQKIGAGAAEPFITDKVIIKKIWQRMSREMYQVMFGHPA
jgi:hypothetical protein